MSGIKSYVDFSQVKKFQKTVRGAKEEYNEFLKDFLIETGEKTVDIAKKYTPVDTGALQDSWGIMRKWMIPIVTRLYSSYKGRMVRKVLFRRGGEVKISRNGKQMYIRVSNPQKYASIIEDKAHMNRIATDIVNNEMSKEYNRKLRDFRSKHKL